jgi:hypothetical protein
MLWRREVLFHYRESNPSSSAVDCAAWPLFKPVLSGGSLFTLYADVPTALRTLPLSSLSSSRPGSSVSDTQFSVICTYKLFHVLSEKIMILNCLTPITVSTRSKAWTVFASSNTAVAGSNPIRAMNVYVCLFCVCVVLCAGRRLATGWSPRTRSPTNCAWD